MQGRYFCAALGILLGMLILGNVMNLDGWAQTSYPNKPIEYVVQASAGGASDSFVRNIAAIFQSAKIIPVPMVIVNKPGGSGAISYAYTAQKAGNPYYLQNTPANFITTPLEKTKVPGYKEFTPIARLAMDENVIAVNADSAYKSMNDLIESGKKKPKEIRFGGTSIGAPDHLTMYLIQRSAKCQFNYISFTGENEVIAALLGGHVEAGCFNPRMVKGLVEANKVRMLATASENRLTGLPKTPTMTELGIQAAMSVQRGVVAPKGIPEDAKKYLITAFKKLTQTQAWKKYVEENFLSEAWVEGDEYHKYLAAETEKIRVIMKELGLIKS
jgi:putative tricarboxylic transport membrane protein